MSPGEDAARGEVNKYEVNIMHISDGVLSLPVVVISWAITMILLVITLWRAEKSGGIAEQIPKLSVMTGAFFVASLVHVPIGPTSVHLILNGLLGVVLGLLSYPAMFIGLTLQALLFQHGGITVIGVNTMVMGIPALISYAVFKKGYKIKVPLSVLGGLCGALAIIFSVLLMAIVLITTGEEFLTVAKLAVVAHIPIMVVEAIITGFVVAYLAKIKPELLPINLGDRK